MRKKSIWKKAAAAVTAAVLLAGNPAAVYAEELQDATTEANQQNPHVDTLTVAGKVLVEDGQLTGETYPGVGYDEETGVVTFENADIKGNPTGNYDQVVEIRSFNTEHSNFTLELIGDNKISVEDGVQYSCSLLRFIDYTATETDTVTIKGPGTLNLEAAGNVRNGIIMGRYSGPRTNFVMNGCTININVNLHPNAPDDSVAGWFMGIHGAGDMEMNSAELNIIAAPESEGYVYGTLNDAAEEEGMDGTLKATDSKYYFRGTQEGWNSALFSLNSAEFINSDIELDCVQYGAPVFNRERDCDISIDDSTTFKWMRGDEMDTSVGKVHFHVSDNSQIYIKETSQDTWRLASSADAAFTEENGSTNVWKSFMVSPGEIAGAAGDINGDQLVNLQDVTLCLDDILGKKELTGDQVKAADLNQDNTINMVDCTQLLNLVLNG